MRTFAHATRYFKWSISILLLLMVTITQAQEKTITGLVKNNENGQPVENASVQVKGTNQVTASGNDGRYSIKANSDQVIVVTAVGFRPIEKLVGTQSVINFDMVTADKEMDV